MKARWVVFGGLSGLAAATTGGLVARHNLGRCCEDGVWTTTYYPKFQELGTIKRLTILPLVEWNTSDGTSASSEQVSSNGAQDHHVLVGAAGVSYLIRADDTTLLFDVGYNRRGEHPSPLLRNMQTLSVLPEELDYVFISHLHLDHVGGMVNQRRHTFSFSEEPLNLVGVTALVPVPMTHPTAKVELEEEPRVIAPGIVNLGPIPRQLFFLGWTQEQSLAVNVVGKGIVLIVGCGHPTIQRIVDRAEMLFDAPLYGVVGGLHYPVTTSRMVKLGLPIQRMLGTGKRPWSPITCQDVEDGITYLQRRHPQLVALSAHDSCDWALEAFRQAFGEAYQELRVGETIRI